MTCLSVPVNIRVNSRWADVDLYKDGGWITYRHTIDEAYKSMDRWMDGLRDRQTHRQMCRISMLLIAKPRTTLGYHVYQKPFLAWPRLNIKMSSYRYRKSHCGDKAVVRSSYRHNGISYTGKMTYLYWIGAQVPQTFVKWLGPLFQTLINVNHSIDN